MVVLKKIKASSLIETITASVIIVIVFSMALLILHSVFTHKINNDTSVLFNHIHQLEYRLKNKQIKLPYQETFDHWEIEIVAKNENLTPWIEINAAHLVTKKRVQKKSIYATD